MAEENRLSRRNVLKTLGASGIATTGFSQLSLAADTPSVQISNLAGDEKKRTINKAKSHPDFKKIRKEFKKDGWKISENRSKVAEITNKSLSTSYRLLVAGLESKNDERGQRYIVWSDLNLGQLNSNEELYSVTGHQFKRDEAKSTNWEVSKTTVQDNSVYTDSSTIDVSDRLDTAGSSDCGPNECYKPKLSCDSFNWECILLTAGAYVTTAAACGSCAFGSGSCLYCLGALLTSGGVTISCDLGVNCDTKKQCTVWCGDNLTNSTL